MGVLVSSSVTKSGNTISGNTTKIVVVKAQIHAGGRGKAGGVKLAKSPAEAADLAKSILGMKLVTPQTGPGGRIVQRLLIEEGLDIKGEGGGVGHGDPGSDSFVLRIHWILRDQPKFTALTIPTVRPTFLPESFPPKRGEAA